MRQGTARFARQLGEHGYFAKVTVQIEPSSSALTTVDCAPVVLDQVVGLLGITHGALSEGVQHAADHALIVAHAEPAKITITMLSGMPCDTTASTISAACALAVWDGLGFNPSTQALQAIEDFGLGKPLRSPGS